MNTYLVKFPGVWFDGWAIVVATNEESARFYTMNRRDAPSTNPYHKPDRTLTIDDFKVKKIDLFVEGIHEYYSGDY